MSKNARLAGYRRNDEFHKDEPEKHAFFKPLIKKHMGDIYKVVEDEKYNADEGWQADFIDYWEDFEVNKSRLSPQQVAAAKALAALAPSLRGDSVVPRELRAKSLSEAEKARFAGQHVWIIYIRASGGFSKGIQGTMVSAVNQLRDYQAKRGDNSPMTILKYCKTKFNATHFSSTLLARVSALLKAEAIPHFFVLGLEGLNGTSEALTQLYDHIRTTAGTDVANSTKIVNSCQETELENYIEGSTNTVSITDNTSSGRCLENTLGDLLSTNPSPGTIWLKQAFKSRVDARNKFGDGSITLDQLKGAGGVWSALKAASLNIRRNRPYGNLNGMVTGDSE